MKLSDIPVIGSGPGSQPEEADGAELNIMPMPGEMGTFTMPVIPEPEETAELVEARALLGRLLTKLTDYQVSQPAEVLDITSLDDANRELVDQVLGEGEVSIQFESAVKTRIQESVLAGVWRVLYLGDGDSIIRDTIEIAAIPRLVSQNTFASAADSVSADGNALSPLSLEGEGVGEGERNLSSSPSPKPSPPRGEGFNGGALPEGVLNAPPLLAEINDKIGLADSSSAPHVINLTLLPQTEQDLEFLGKMLGQGPVSVLSRGYGNCRITSTATKNVWWVQYFNSQDMIILNTLEVTPVPSAACASQEDIEDSAGRLQEILEAYL